MHSISTDLICVAAVTMLAAVPAKTASAGVLSIDEPIAIDGSFREPAWGRAVWEGDFSKFENVTQGREVRAKTEFALLADARNVYLGVRCHESEMERVRAKAPSSLWGGDTVEFFFAPSGVAFDFYHFAVGFKETNGRYSDFASEGGVIHPDPYRPDWQVARGEFEGGWTLEIAIPLASFYMNRNSRWSDEWLVNVCRTRTGSPRNELTTWSPLFSGFCEPKRFRKVKGFPKRRPADDVAMLDLNAVIGGRGEGGLVGQATMKIAVAEAGDFEISSPNLATTGFRLTAGDNTVKVGCTFPGNGRHPVPLVLKRLATGETYRREYPVSIDFREIAVKLTSPQYRDNFYPGQCADRVKGRVSVALKGEVKVSLEGEGFPKREVTLPEGGGEIDFDTKGFRQGTEAKLSVASAGSPSVSHHLRIRNLAPTGHRMAWIENGRLVVDGRPTLRRNIYALYYMGGEAFREKFDADPDLYMTREICGGGTLEANRVIPGLERKEAIRDVMPCKEYFAKIDAMVEKSKDRDFVYWYISDEPECRGLSPIYLRHVYEHMKEIDPYHPLLTASRGGAKYIDCADWFETHPYLDPHDDGKGNRRYGVEPAAMGGYLDAFQAWDRPDKCIGFLPTLFAYRGKSLLNDYPTLDEYICETWAAMVHGGKSLFPYAYHDMGDRPALYEGNRYVFSSFAALENLVLDAKRTWLVRNNQVKAVRYDLGDESMFVVVNLTQEPQTAVLDGLVGTYREFRGKRTFTSASDRRIRLNPLETIVATTKPHDGGLPSYAEVKALVDRLEAERKGRDSQLVENYEDVVVTASKPVGSCYKLFDGTRDVICFDQEWCPETFVELSFPKAAKRFHVVRVFGRWKSADPVVSIRKDGEWVELKPVGTPERTKDSVVYDFGEPVRTIKMRLTFRGKGRNHVELYEIELGRDGAETAAARSSGAVRPENPLWFRDEKTAEGSPKHGAKPWLCAPELIAPREGGGFVLKGQAMNYGVRVTPEARWFTTRLEKFTPSRKGYLAWSVYMMDTRRYLCGGVTHPQAGVYTIPIRPVEKAQRVNFVWYDYNFDLEFAYAALEKEPAEYALCELAGGGDRVREGDVLKFTVRLRDPAEELSAAFMCDGGGGAGQQPYAVNGTNAIMLGRADADGRLWTGEIKVRSFKPTKHKVYVKVTALGGTLDLPLFTTAPSFS